MFHGGWRVLPVGGGAGDGGLAGAFTVFGVLASAARGRNIGTQLAVCQCDDQLLLQQ